MWVMAGMATFTIAKADVTMSLTQNDQSTQQYAVSDIASISYADGTMNITLLSGEQVAVPVAQVKEITFTGLSTAIQSLSQQKAGIHFAVYDINGTLLYEGVTETDGNVTLPTELTGVCVVRVGNKSRKVVIK